MPAMVGLITEYYLDCSVYYEHLQGSSEDTAKIQIPCGGNPDTIYSQAADLSSLILTSHRVLF